LLSAETPVHVYKGYLPYLAATKDYQQIMTLMPRLQEHFAHDPDIQLIFGQALEYSGKQQEADALYINLSRTFKTHPDIIVYQEIVYRAVNSYRRNKERGNAIHLIDDLLNNNSPHTNKFIFHFMKAQLYTELNDAPNARSSVEKSLELHPHFDKGWLLFGMLEENAGKLDDAIKGYTNFLELSGASNEQLEKHLLELMIKRRMLKINQQTMSIDNKCLLDGLSLFQKKEYRKGLQSIDKCLETEPANKQDATIIKINMLGAMRKHRQAMRLLKETLHADPHNEIWYTHLHALNHNGVSLRDAINLLQETIHHHPHAPLAHIHIAELYQKKGILHESIYHYQRALEYINDTHTQTRIMYNLACLYAEAQNYDRMKSLLTIIMKQSPEFMPANHLMAYHYLEREHDLVRAEKLLAVAIKDDPYNTHYRITQARIFRAYGEYDEALKTLQTARVGASLHALIDTELYMLADNYIKNQRAQTHIA